MTRPPSAAGRDLPLTDAQRETLRLLAGTFVPASADGRIPAASDMPPLLQSLAALAAAVPAMRAALDAIDAEAASRHGASFAALDEASRSLLLDEIRARDAGALHRLCLETVTCYYQQDEVLERLGLGARPPYPKGYEVLSGDLALLNPVKARGRIYRDAGEG